MRMSTCNKTLMVRFIVVNIILHVKMAITCEGVRHSSETAGNRIRARSSHREALSHSPSKSISREEQTKSVQSHLHSNELNLYEAAIFASYDLDAVVRRSRMNLIRPSVFLQEPKTHQSSSKLLRPSFFLPKPIILDFQLNEEVTKCFLCIRS